MEILHTIVEREEIMLMLLVAIVLVVGSVGKTISTIVRSTARERTRREIAAYIAEGSMSPEQGERLMRAGAKEPPASA